MIVLHATTDSNLLTCLRGMSARADIAVGYFFMQGFEALAESLSQLYADEHRPFVRLLDCIFEAKNAEPDADASELEEQTDRLVYGLYSLTEEERTAVGD